MKVRGRQKGYTRLILLSGGIDSTYLLAHALRETQDTVLVHHVHLKNIEGRDRAEAEACEKIVAYCRETYRDFKYTESTVDRRGFRAMGYDVITVAAEAGIAASNHYLETGKMPDFWMLGLNQEEAEELRAPATVPPTSQPPKGAQNASGDRLKYLLAVIAASCYPNDPPKYLRPVIKPKQELMTYMGKDLVDLCWTCRRPVHTDTGFAECGKCTTCLLMGKIRQA